MNNFKSFDKFFLTAFKLLTCYDFFVPTVFFLMFYFINYFSSGINKWRDSRTPKQILEKYCETNNFLKPRFIGNNRVIFHGDEFFLEDFGKLSSQFIHCKQC